MVLHGATTGGNRVSRRQVVVFSSIFMPSTGRVGRGLAGRVLAANSTTSISEAAQRYSAAIFDLALDSGEVDSIEAGLSALANAITENRELGAALRSPLVKSEEKAAVLEQIGDKLALPELAKRFVGVVAQNNRAGDVVGMARSFADKAARHRGASRVVARVAKSISDDQKRQLESTVSKSLGRDVSVEVEVDPSLIGGIQLKMGSRLVDASIRRKLNALTNIMKGA